MNIYAKSICKERVKMLKQCFDNVREKHPLVHNITNYVTVNDVANILLACGGSPIMADDSGEVEDITSICQGLNINIGTLNKNTIPSMFLAGKKANVLGHVVLLDPVGAGASGLRTKTANELVRDIKFTVIRGNISEIRTLMEGTGNTKGVDADLADAVTEENLDETIEKLKAFSEATGSVIAVTAAVCAMGIAGEIGFEHLKEGEGNSTYRNRIIDAIYHMDGNTLEERAKYELR